MTKLIFKAMLFLMPIFILFAVIVSVKDIGNFNIVNHFKYLKTIDFGSPIKNISNAISDFNSGLSELEFAKATNVNSLSDFFSLIGNWTKNFGKLIANIITSSISMIKVIGNTIIESLKHIKEIYEWLTLGYLE